MIDFDATTETKIAALRVRYLAGETIEVHELVGVEWPSPDGTIYYSVSQTDETVSVAPSVSPIEVRLIPEGDPNWFLPVALDNSIGDEELDLNFWDGDEVISQLLVDHGEGVKATLYYWFPQETLLLTIWHGHLRFEDEAAADIIPVKAVQGFRSSEANVPHRAHWQECQAIFGGLFATQGEIDEHDCPYNLHIGGAVGIDDPATTDPWTYCDRRSTASCTARGVDTKYHLSHYTITSITQNNQTSGPNLLVTSNGNETNLKEPVRVIMGKRRIRDCKVMAWLRATNTNTPSHGFFHALYELCEGPIQSINQVRVAVENTEQAAIAIHYGYRLGTKGQTPVYTPLTTHAYSGTAHIRYTYGWVDPREVEPGECSATALIEGLDNIRVYTDDVTYTEEYTTNRAWQIARILTDKRWGFGLDYARLNIDSFIAAADWCEETVRFTDTFGTDWDHMRADSNVELIEKKIQQQIEDMCVAGRLSRPFLFNGQIHIVPLRELTSGELAAVFEFTDEGENRNIIWEGEPGEEKTTLTISRKSSLDLINRVECTYDYVGNDHLETPLQPVEDIDAQLAAGRVVGDLARKINPKKYNLLGVTTKPHAVKMAWSLLDLGPCDDGGLQNNLAPKFKCWFADALKLHPERVIKITSSRLTKYGFTYFRVKKIQRLDDLQYEITCQAYNETYMASFEETVSITPDTCPYGFQWDDVLLACVPIPIDPPCVLTFGTPSYVDGAMVIPIDPCI